MDDTLTRLLVVEVAVSLAVLGVLALTTWLLVRRELRPLEAMASDADAIASGDLSRRIERSGTHTEVGRLGAALNAMLAQIERALAESRASEDRLRRFLADASHELRTPLTSIRGYAELFRRGAGRDPDDLALAMRRIEEEGGRMGVIVDDLLLLARLDQGRPLQREPVDLVTLAEDAVADARAADPQREVSLAAPDDCAIAGDEARLRQALANLLSNALTHTPSGTPVHVVLERRPDAADGAGEAVLTVADEGPGIAASDLERVFEPFHRGAQAADDESGAGLGLAIVAAIVKAHDGSVSAAGEPGAGATLTVHLPLASGAGAPPDPGIRPAI
jgi:two-component system OmpR family sensor kinase